MNIKIEKKGEQIGKNIFEVLLEADFGRSYSYEVIIDKDYIRSTVGKDINPQLFLYASFEFLLGQESPNSILNSFNVSEISNYFSSFEDEIKKQFNS